MKKDDFELPSFEEIADSEPPDGVFTDPNPKDARQVRVRALFKYCEERGIEPNDLTEEECEQFLY